MPTASARVRTPNTSTDLTTAASLALAAGKSSLRMPRCEAFIAIANAPRTGRRLPLRATGQASAVLEPGVLRLASSGDRRWLAVPILDGIAVLKGINRDTDSDW